MKIQSNAGLHMMHPLVAEPSQRESLEQPRLGRDLSALNRHESGQSPLQFAMTKMAALFAAPAINGECTAASSPFHTDDIPSYARAVLGLSHDDSEIDETLAPYLDELSKNESAIQAQSVTRSSFLLLCMLYLADQVPGASHYGQLQLTPTSFSEWLQCQLPDSAIRHDLIPKEYFDTAQVFKLKEELSTQYVIKCSHPDEFVAAVVTSIRPINSRIDSQPSKQQDVNLSSSEPRPARSRRVASPSLRDFDLRGVDLRGATLQGVDLDWAQLEGANLQGADLRGARLQSANLRGVNLQGADLQGTELRHAKLHQANLRGANLQHTSLRGAALPGANLQGASLLGANLRGATLQGADLQHANLRDADLERTDLSDADLQGANLEDVWLSMTALRDANLRNAVLDWRILFRSDVESPRALLPTLSEHALKSDVASRIRSRTASDFDVRFNHRNNDGRSVLRNIESIDDRCRPQKQALMRAVIAELDNVRMHDSDIIADLVPSLGDVLFQDAEYLKGYDDFVRWMCAGLLGEGQSLLDNQIKDSALKALGEHVVYLLETGGLDAVTGHSTAFYQVLHTTRERAASAPPSEDNERRVSRAQTIHDRYIGILSDRLPSLVGTGSVYENERDVLGDDDIFPLLSADGRSCVIMTDEHFKQLVLGNDPSASEGRSQWDNLRCVKARQDGTFPASVANATEGGTRGTTSTAPILDQFPLLRRARQRNKATETQHQILALSGLAGTLLERFKAALLQSETHDKLTEAADQLELGTIFETKYEDREGQVHLAATHFAALQAQWQDDQPKDFAFRLLCMSALYTNYASSNVFGKHDESPYALRLYAEGLLRKAHELDPGLVKDDTFADWTNRLRGEADAFTCTSILYGMESEHLELILREQPDNDTLLQIRDEVIPLTWR